MRTTELLQKAMKDNGITYGDLIQRVAADHRKHRDVAAANVDRLEQGFQCPLIVAVSLVTLITDLRKAAHDNTD